MTDILVVDDDEHIRESLVDLLEGEGYSVRTAADGLAALAAWSEKRPDLMDRVDKGEQSISGAYRDMQQTEKPKANDTHSFIEEEPVDIPEYQVYKPAQQEAPGNVRTVKGADHEHLLENPIYCRLYESYNDAVQQINLVRGEMRTRCEGYERRIRGYRENIQTLQQEVERLREALHAGT